ncbi:OmpA family protein [Sphingomonas sp.]|uniref:OmpA family protein n=1 Tax=Sphingomonas sp. TaxID=28214 RepID=UPI00286CA1A5|nr:OmpA family protein [Sphingomonas sp.]
MRRFRTLAALALAGPLLATAGCGNVFAPAPYGPPQAALMPAVPAYLLGDVIGGYAMRLKKARAAGLKPVAPTAIADYVSQQEQDLRRESAGTGVDVIRSGDRLFVRLPSSSTFNVGRSDISQQAFSTLGEIGLTLKKYDRSLVDVLGHTDSTGTEAGNKALSEKRAQAVAAMLRSRGVSAARIATRGFGASQSIGDNGTEAGRSLNRRVEIKVVPLR